MDTTLSQRLVKGKDFPARLATATAWLTGLSCVTVVFSIAVSQILLAAALASLLPGSRRAYPDARIELE